MKDAMIFLAKVQKKKNRQLCEQLARLTEEQRRKFYPNLGMNGGSIHDALAGFVGNGVFTLPAMGLSGVTKDTVAKFIGGEMVSPMGDVMYQGKTYKDESFEILSSDLAEMMQLYVDVFEAASEDEFVNVNSMGLPPFDFCLKGMLGQFDTRGQIEYILKEEGLCEPIEDGPLADD